MLIDSRHLLQQLLQQLTLEETQAEKEAILVLVLEHELNLSKTDILLGKKVKADSESFSKIVNRLNQNEPVQYVLGEAWFYGRKFIVNPSVLIPRPETELLVKTVVDRFHDRKSLAILDIGTGSGCIGVSLALELPRAVVTATDISDEALSVARRNADKLRASVQFQHHDILKHPLGFGLLDVVVSNPPYVLNEEKIAMKKNVVDFEPTLALFVPDTNPLLFYEAIAEKTKAALKSGGLLITEINERLASETVSLFRKHDFAEVEVINDLEGKTRFVCGRTEL